jgi:DNA-binding CsgD family transcriptional regulator
VRDARRRGRALRSREHRSTSDLEERLGRRTPESSEPCRDPSSPGLEAAPAGDDRSNHTWGGTLRHVRARPGIMRPPSPGARVLVLLPETGASPGPDGVPAAGELILDGRRYRLVPVPDETRPPPAQLPPARLSPARPAAAALTAREREICALVAAGCVNKEIAARLAISAWTVSTHLRRIYAKLGVENRAAMVSRVLAPAPGRA